MADWKCPDYQIEHHNIETSDHYVLALSRVRSSKEDFRQSEQFIENSNKPPVLIVHGFVCSSEHWLINSPDKVLPYRFVDEGYDCWLGNLRGSTLSRGHSQLDKGAKSKKYWNFSWHEMAQFDIPAMIDYILAITGKESLHYIGHSMGCAIGFLVTSLRPEYCSKIKMMSALAPCVHGSHITNKFFLPFIPLGNLFGKSKFLANRELFGQTLASYGKKFFPWKSDSEKVGGTLLKTFGVRLGVCGTDQIEKERMKTVSANFPSPTSIKLFCHGTQCFRSGLTRQYDYGRSGNLKVYGQATPPEYDFNKVKIPVAIFYSDDDLLCPPGDILQLSTELPNLVELNHITQPQFTHLDFMLGKDVNPLVYDRVIQIHREVDFPTKTTAIA